MALTQCRECGKSVSMEAVACPHCGAPQQRPVPPVRPVQSSLAQPKEEIIYTDNVVTVTDARIIIWGTTYAVRNATSVKMVSTPPRIGGAILLLIFGVLILLAAFMPLNDHKAPVEVYVISGVLIGGAILWMLKSKTHFHVGLSTASGELHVLTSKDKAHIHRVVQSINEAIVRSR